MPASAEIEDPSRAWAGLGATGEGTAGLGTAGGGALADPVTVHAVELRMVELTFRRPVRTAQGVHRRRPVVLVRIVGRDGHGAVDGWGECAALADTTYDTEDATSAMATLASTLVPALLAASGPGHGPRRASTGSGGAASGAVTLPSMAELGAMGLAVAGSHLAFSGLEMAVADAHLRSGGRSFASLLGVAGSGPVPAGAVVGRYDRVDDLVARVDDLVGKGYARVKMKIGPGWDVEPVLAVRTRFAGLIVQVDANESYSGAGGPDLEALLGLDELGLACIEQPFPRADLGAHARLAGRMATPICLDESLDSPARVAEALSSGACSVVCIKPARLGGIGAALQVVGACAGAGAPMWMGGMFESGYGRSVTTTLAALPGFSWPGDTSPARSYLVEDVAAAPMSMRDPSSGTLGTLLADAPGMAPAPDASAVDRLSTRLVRIDARSC